MRPGRGHKVFLVGHGVGVQIYSCRAAQSGFAWSFVAPRANLYGDSGRLVITHFGGPTWQAGDGSKVVGRVDASPLTVDPIAVPWLRLAGTTFIQRIATVGGVAPPAAECNASAVGTVREVPYTADYYFWKKTGA
jgi:uncharacterized protein DUF3455